MADIDVESLPKIDCAEVVGDGWYPDEPRVLVNWPTDGRADAPIHINFNGLRGALKPNTDTVMPDCVAQMLLNSGYAVAIKCVAIVNHGADEVVNEMVDETDEAKAKIAAIADMSVADLVALLPSLSLAELRDLLIAEETGKNRTTAVAPIAQAIDGHPEQIAALEKAAAEGVTNDGSQQNEQTSQ